MEIERKFILHHFPDEVNLKSKKKILQGYLAANKNDLEIRIRKYGRSYFETIKTSGSLVRAEIEIKLTKVQFESLWPFTESKRIEKDRYSMRLGPHIVEIDIYLGKLKDLRIAEVEFSSIKESENFIPPDWFGNEVTEDPMFKNKNLAC